MHAVPQIAVSSLVKTIKAHLEKAKQAQDRSEQHYISAGLHLAELKDRYKRDVKASKTQTWEVYVRETFGLGRSRADELIRIADGRATLEDTRAAKAASVAKSKTKTKTAASSGGSGNGGSVAVFGDRPMSQTEAKRLAAAKETDAPGLAPHQIDLEECIADHVGAVQRILDAIEKLDDHQLAELKAALRQQWPDGLGVRVENVSGLMPDIPACLRRSAP